MAKGQALGVPPLDALMAPVPIPATLLIANDPGIEAEPFLYQATHHHLAHGRTVVYAVTTRPPASVLEAMRPYGFAPPADAGRLIFLDAYSGLLGLGGDPGAVQDPRDLSSVARRIQELGRENPGAILLFDSLSTLVDNTSPEAFLAAFPRLRDAIGSFVLSACLFTRWPYPAEVMRVADRFDGVVHLSAMEERILYGQYLSVERAGWRKDADPRPRPYKAIQPGGVVLYVPKILVTGPPAAGKSTFVRSVSGGGSRSVERMGTTVALDHGQVQMEGVVADVFGTPGQTRFDPILKTLAGQALGVIIIVDATRPETFDRAHVMMRRVWKQGLPIVVAANKQDKEDALKPDEVKRRLDFPSNPRVLPCVAEDPASARKIVQALLDQILFPGAKP